MLTENRRSPYMRLNVGRPKSSMPQKKTSVHLDLEMLYTRKNALENNLEVYKSKVGSLNYEINNLNKSIYGLESCIYNRLCGDIKGIWEKKRIETGTESVPSVSMLKDNIEVVDFQY